jgi:AcrR family transcriptional regulator
MPREGAAGEVPPPRRGSERRRGVPPRRQDLRAGAPARERELRPRGRRTVERLLAAGVEVFARVGYPAARVDDIVRAARTSHGTFYLYFSSKEDLLLTLAEACSAEMVELAESLGPVGPGPEGLAELERWLRRFLELYRRYGTVVRAWTENQVANPELVELGSRALQAMTSALSRRIQEAAPPGLSPQLASFAFVAMIERFSYFAYSRRLPFGDEAAAHTLAVLLHGGVFGAGRSGRARRLALWR